jgi:hypothetical protein
MIRKASRDSNRPKGRMVEAGIPSRKIPQTQVKRGTWHNWLMEENYF